MSIIFVVDQRSGTAYRIDFATLVSLVKGTSITSLADSEQFIEFRLSERMNIRFESGEDEGPVQISLFSTLNADEVPPTRVQLINDGEEPTAARVERRLHSLRQVYAITLMLDAGRGAELAVTLLENPDVDLEQSLLREDEQLYLREAGSSNECEPGRKSNNKRWNDRETSESLNFRRHSIRSETRTARPP
jgi:hypothetical protein